MKKFLSLGLIVGLLSLATPAHASRGGLILDLIQLGINVFDGTIPLPFVIGFLVLILAIVVLAVINARKAAQETPETEPSSGGISLDK
ncbi:hypothetical protein EON80_26780 [bacterium]|nr:MAG: hypothetical protein EON80_26780 [bacterium]